MLQRRTVQELHRNERPIAIFPDLMDRADIRMIERRRSPRFPTEAFRRLRILGYIIGQKLQRNEPPSSVSSALYTTPIPPPPSFSTMR